MGTVQQPLLCVVHIPKTAGSAIRETLISSLGPEKVYWIGHKRPYAHWESAAGTEFDDYAVVGGHRSAAAFQKNKKTKDLHGCSKRSNRTSGISFQLHYPRS